ncbi:MAG: deoxyribose-phosphate aldolase [Desulfurococcales archaeon]|nr:deoxyribose-phosphate aldolase [Desulfurococcales archaeon]
MIKAVSDDVKTILRNISKYIDQTLLKFELSLKEYIDFVNKSEKYDFRSIVVPSAVVEHVASISKLPVVGVVGFPFGYHPVEAKIKEIEAVANGGGREVDAVINLIYLKEGLYDKIKEEIKSLVSYAHDLGLSIKIIIETSILTVDEIIKTAEIVASERADFIKTNTGFGPRGVCLEDIILIKDTVGDKIRIKAAGGVRTALDAAYLVLHGADVIGTSRGIKIVEEAEKLLGLSFK